MSSDNAWRLDALDARGGLAFATWRGEENGNACEPDSESRSVFIGAPGFQPEIVANRSIAFSSARGLFQPGLFVKKEEITFRTVAAVAEFVRRTYLSGGGGDGSDDGGGDVPPLPEDPDGRPDLPGTLGEIPKTDHEQSLAGTVYGALENFINLSRNTPPGEANFMERWPQPATLQKTTPRASSFTEVKS